MRKAIGLYLLLFCFKAMAQFPASSATGQTWAVIVGISNYQDEDITDLEFADDDAHAFYNFLRSPAGGLLPEANIQLLVNEKATRIKFHEALTWLTKVAKPGDQVFIYFSGHADVETTTAFNDGFLLTYDSPANNYPLGAYGVYYLQRIITDLSMEKKAKVVLVADACRSGKLAGMEIKGAQVTMRDLMEQQANEIKILACEADEYSVEGPQWGGGHGVFSYHLIGGLEGLADRDGDDVVNLMEIEQYLLHKVTTEAAPNRQTPFTKGDRRTPLSIVQTNQTKALAAKQTKETPTIGLVGTKNLETSLLAQEDSLARKWYAAFQKSMDERHLLEPQQNNAYHYYQLLKAKYPNLQLLLDAMSRNLATALQEDAQQVILAYLKTDPKEMTRRWSNQSQVYSKIPAYLEKSIELLRGDRHYMYNVLKSSQLYFEALLLRMESEQKEAEAAASPLLEQAIAKLNEAIQLEPAGAHLYNELGLAYSALEESEKEMAAYKKAHELSPTWVMPLNNLAALQLDAQQWEEAIQWSKQTIALKPDFALGYYHLGTVLMHQGKPNEAEPLLRKAIELDPKLELAYWNLGSLLYSAEKYEPAATVLKKLTTISPDYAEGYYMLGSVYYVTKRYKPAEEMYQKAIQLAPTHPYAHLGLAMVMEANNQWEQAIELYKKNLEITPAYPVPNYSISVIYARKQQVAQALEWLEKALNSGYDDFEEIAKEAAFDQMRTTAAFQTIITNYQKK